MIPGGIAILTDRRMARRPLVETVAASVEGGARCVVLREKDMDPDERAALAAALRAVLADAGGRLIVAGADPLGGDAVHLAAAGPYPPPDLALVGRSCHGEAELSRLSREHYAMVSPVFPTPSKPGYGPPLGLDGLARLVDRSPVPVLALGGITPRNAAGCLAAGAAGVAVMGAVMRADDPAAVVRDFVRSAHFARWSPPAAGAVHPGRFAPRTGPFRPEGAGGATLSVRTPAGRGGVWS